MTIVKHLNPGFFLIMGEKTTAGNFAKKPETIATKFWMVCCMDEGMIFLEPYHLHCGSNQPA